MAVHKWRKWLSAALVCIMLASGGAAYAESETGGEGAAGQTGKEAAGGAGQTGTQADSASDGTATGAGTADGSAAGTGAGSSAGSGTGGANAEDGTASGSSGAGSASGTGGSAGSGSGSSSGAVTGFPDVPNNHWARKHITKLNLQGIVKGNEQGMFVPAGNVTQQDAVLMALRFTGAADKVDPNNPVIFPENFFVSNYAKAYVMQAINDKLIEESVEFNLAASEPDVQWGTKPATREWVTKLIVRAIGETARAESRAHDLPAFSDASDIADMYVGYVNAAVDLGIVKGVSGDKFAPKNTVTRAEMATMLSRAQSLYPVAYKGQYSGVLTALSGSQLALSLENGSSETFTVGSDTAFYRFDSESASAAANLKLYTKATVIADGRKALYVEQLDDAERLEKSTGELVSVDLIERMLYVKIGSRVETIPYDSGTKVLDNAGADLGLAALAEEGGAGEVDIYRETFSEAKRAVRIELKSAQPVSKQGRGTIVSVQPGEVVILDEGAEQAETWEVAFAASISKQGAAASMSDLRSGDVVAYTVEKGVVTQIAVESGASRTVTGLFDSYVAAQDRIIYVVGGELMISNLATGAVLEIPGFSAATWSDLYKDDKLELTLDGNNQVTKVKVLDRNITTVNGATIVVLADNLLTFRDQNGIADVVEISGKTRIEVNNSDLTLEAAKTLFSAGRKVTITYSEDQAIVIRFAYRHTGSLSAVDTAGSRLVLKLDDGSTVTIPYDKPSVQIRGKSSASLADLKAGDRVTVQLDQNLDKALLVMAHTVEQMKVDSINAANRRVKLASDSGSASEYTLSSDAQVLNEKGESLPLAQLAPGRTVNAEFAGNELIRLQTVIVKVGKITAIAPGTVTFAEYGGAVQDIALGANFKIVKNGAESASTAALAAGDRAEIRTNASGEYVVTVIPGLEKTFWRYDAAANAILVRKVTLTENNQYKLSPDTLVTSGDQKIEAASLKEDDKIVLYILNGKLLEVEKR